MITKRELKYIEDLDREIVDASARLVSLKCRIRGGGEIKPGSHGELLVSELEESLSEKIRQRSTAKERVCSFLDTVSDSRTRQILYYRYVKALSWKKVAHMLGKEGDGEAERKISSRYLKEIGVV